jgi:hypothetical protein
MKRMNQVLTLVALVAVIRLASIPAAAQTCFASADMEPALLSALRSTAQDYYKSAQAGDAAALQPLAEFNMQDVLEEKKDFLAAPAVIRSVYLLDNSQAGGRRAEFFCGVYNSSNLVGFAFGALAPGRYGVVIQDLTGGKIPATVSWILHQNGGQWKIGGLYIKATQIAGHDGDWYLSQARSYKAKGQGHNAWFYYKIADDLERPFPAMSTPQLDKLYDEMQPVRPSDLPASGQPVELSSAGRVFQLLQVFPATVDDHLDLVVRYQAPDISDTGKTFQDNMALINALVGRYPELHGAFTGVVARAVAPNGQDYGSLLAMKDVKATSNQQQAISNKR